MPRSKSEPRIRVDFSLADIIAAIKKLNPEDKEFFIENLLAATNPEYLDSIKEAREDYQKGRVITHEELFKKVS
jgi:hypothetical protein